MLRVQLTSLARAASPGWPRLSPTAARAEPSASSAITRVCVEVFRGLPVVITIFFVGSRLPAFGMTFDNPAGTWSSA